MDLKSLNLYGNSDLLSGTCHIISNIPLFSYFGDNKSQISAPVPDYLQFFFKHFYDSGFLKVQVFLFARISGQVI